MCTELVGHRNGTAKFAGRQRLADVNVTELEDAKAFKSFGEIGNWQSDTNNLKRKSLNGVSVKSREYRRAAE
jgi:hypothetical protein